MAKLACFSLIVLGMGSMSSGAEPESTADRRNDILGAHSLTLPAPIRRWDCALPLGNGLTGGLLWGEGGELRLSLDRGDLWDERGNEDVYSPDRNFETLTGIIHIRWQYIPWVSSARTSPRRHARPCGHR